MAKEIMELKFKFPIIYIRNIKINNFKIKKVTVQNWNILRGN